VRGRRRRSSVITISGGAELRDSTRRRLLVPIAVIIAWISLLERTLLMRFFLGVDDLPRSGRIAYSARSRPALAEPPGGSRPRR